MKRVEYPVPLQTLVRELKRLPGVGPRSADRMALWLLGHRDAHPAELASAISSACSAVRPCARCGFFSIDEICALCSDPARQDDVLCVVEEATDILPLERTGVFRGRYHALGGRLSPLDGVGPADLRIEALLERVKSEPLQEIILALGCDVEGEATSNYLAGLLAPSGVRLTRLAQGIPAGSGLEHTDEVTLGRALAGRLAV